MVSNSLAIYTSSFVEWQSLWPIIHLYYWVSSTYSCIGICYMLWVEVFQLIYVL